MMLARANELAFLPHSSPSQYRAHSQELDIRRIPSLVTAQNRPHCPLSELVCLYCTVPAAGSIAVEKAAVAIAATIKAVSVVGGTISAGNTAAVYVPRNATGGQELDIRRILFFVIHSVVFRLRIVICLVIAFSSGK